MKNHGMMHVCNFITRILLVQTPISIFAKNFLEEEVVLSRINKFLFIYLQYFQVDSVATL